MKKLGSIEFGFYTEAEAKSLSMVEITQANVYNSSNEPTVGGLSDPRLGVSPGLNDTCQVCNQDTSICPGHLGYLPLAFTAYNPFTIDIAFKLLKSKCSFCHRLKISSEKAQLFILKKKLIKRGKLIDSCSIEDLISKKVINESHFNDLDEVVQQILDEKSMIEELAIQSSLVGNSERFSSLLKCSNEITSQMWKTFSGGLCPHCKKKQPQIKKESDTKIIRHPLKEK